MKDKLVNRETLKNLFSNGKRPNEDNFYTFIDSMVNKVDDGISKNQKDGLILSPEGKESKNVVSFYQKVQDDLPDWSIELVQDKTKGMGFVEPITATEAKTRLFLEKGGNIGINTETPQTNLEINGILGSSSRVGTYKISTVPADGRWHDILKELDGCNAFEIMAQVGKEKAGKYALLHAHALSTFGKSRSKIKATQAHYGWWRNKLDLRWTGGTRNYGLQIRSRSNYGSDHEINFYITKLWDNNIMSSLFNK